MVLSFTPVGGKDTNWPSVFLVVVMSRSSVRQYAFPNDRTLSEAYVTGIPIHVYPGTPDTHARSTGVSRAATRPYS
eukprot:1086150-Rhodomonas_salina.1